MDVMPVFWIALLSLLCNGYAVQASRKLQPPRITPPGEEHVVVPNDDVVLKCKGQEPITWEFPDNPIDETMFKYSTITIDPWTAPTQNYPYGSILTIHNTSYLDTGFFRCKYVNNPQMEASMYLYVDDPEQLSVIPEFPESITVQQGSPVILPCRPTSPQVKVDLERLTGDEVALDKMDQEGSIVSLDKRYGFQVNQVVRIGGWFFDCIFSRGNVSAKSTLYLDVQPQTISIAKPYIEDISGGHTTVGQNLTLKCTLRTELSTFSMTWKVPDQKGLDDSRITISKTRPTPDSQGMYFQDFYQELVIKNATLADQGRYTCVVRDFTHKNNNTIFVKIFDKGEHFIFLTEKNGVYGVSVQAGEPNITWRIDVNSHPLVQLTWQNNKGNAIQSGSKYSVRLDSSSKAILVIKNITTEDRGVYKLKAINEYGEKELNLNLDVTDKPTVRIEMDDFHMVNQSSVFECLVAAYPRPSIYWYFKGCLDDSCDFEPYAPTYLSYGMPSKSYLKLTIRHSGYVRCSANNALGNDASTRAVLVTDVANGFGIGGLDPETLVEEDDVSQYPIAAHDSISLSCAASKYNYYNLAWFKTVGQTRVLLTSNNGYSIERSATEYSNKITLSFERIAFNDTGSYTCEAKKDSGSETALQNVTLSVRDPEMPTISNTNLNRSAISIITPHQYQMWCIAKGLPKPSIRWFKDGNEIVEGNTGGRIQLKSNNRRLVFTKTVPADEGKYSCHASNTLGGDIKEMYLLIENKPKTSYVNLYLFATIIVLVSVAVAILIFLFCQCKKERELRMELRQANLALFEDWEETYVTELDADDRANLLPYKKCELLGKQLKLGGPLGLNPAANVAAEIVKRNDDFTYTNTLASKLMMHLEQHL